ncbi:sphingosine kinase 2 [Scyliorhinus torazame]|uniref:sphingosine kinase 2 n=1 Tax=Scyliorhinus torazame TaxID=75743 RepID=UPI003B5A678E
MAGAPEALLHGEFGGGGPGGGRYALTLTPRELHVQRLGPRAEGERRLVVALCHVLECRTLRGRRAGGEEEGEEEEEEGGAAHFALYCYPPRKRRVGGPRTGRQRLVRVFRADGGAGRAENRALAERWAGAVKCLLLGAGLPGEGGGAAPTTAGTSPSLPPRRRRLLLFVNPRSGRSLAMSYCENHVLPMIQEASISYNLICTEYQNHAREIIQDIKLSEWDGIVIVSGDGLMYEVINGLMERPDWEEAIQMPVGILPAGSGNAVAAAINHNAGYGDVATSFQKTVFTFKLSSNLVAAFQLELERDTS